MRNALLALALVSIASVPAAAQWAPAPRIAHVEEFNAYELSLRAEFLEARGDELERRSAKAIPGQYFAGFAGMVVGTGVGAVTGLLVGMGQGSEQGFENAAVALTLAGLVGGTTYGVVKFSAAKGANGTVPAAIGGTLLGLLGGPVLWVTAPLGARWAYNKSRTDALSP